MILTSKGCGCLHMKETYKFSPSHATLDNKRDENPSSWLENVDTTETIQFYAQISKHGIEFLYLNQLRTFVLYKHIIQRN